MIVGVQSQFSNKNKHAHRKFLRNGFLSLLFFYSRPESMASEDSLEYFLEDELVEFDLVSRLFLDSGCMWCARSFTSSAISYSKQSTRFPEGM